MYVAVGMPLLLHGCGWEAAVDGATASHMRAAVFRTRVHLPAQRGSESDLVLGTPRPASFGPPFGATKPSERSDRTGISTRRLAHVLMSCTRRLVHAYICRSQASHSYLITHLLLADLKPAAAAAAAAALKGAEVAQECQAVAAQAAAAALANRVSLERVAAAERARKACGACGDCGLCASSISRSAVPPRLASPEARAEIGPGQAEQEQEEARCLAPWQSLQTERRARRRRHM